MASVARLRSEGGEADALRLADLLAHASRRLRRASAAELAPLGLTRKKKKEKKIKKKKKK
jgi:hypothetical protein